MLLVVLLVALLTVSASALSIHTPSREQHMIPRIVHQSLQEGALTPAAAHCQKTWKASHPHWEYKCATCCPSSTSTSEHQTDARQACLLHGEHDTQCYTCDVAACPRRLWTHDENNKLVAEHYAWCRFNLPCVKQSALEKRKAVAACAAAPLPAASYLSLRFPRVCACSGLGQQGIRVQTPHGVELAGPYRAISP